MTESIVVSIFEKSNIAEINSLKLIDYGESLNYHFNHESNSKFYQHYFKWFDHTTFDKTNNSFLTEFEQWFYDFF